MHSSFSMFLSGFVLASLTLSAQQAPKAIPVEDGTLVPRAVPIPPPIASPAVAPPKARSPEDDMFDFAILAYERQEWTIAAQNFAKYLQTYPAGKRVAEALFRSGECHREQRQLKQATSYWDQVVSLHPNSKDAPSAAYRLGAISFNQGQNAAADGDKNAARPSLLAAARYFTFCVEKTQTREARLAALYNKSRCHELLGDTKLQTEALHAVVAVQENNPYREAALLSLGTLQLQQDKKTESVQAFEQLIATSRDNAVISDASLRLAVLYQEGKRYDEAIAMFQKAVALPETNESSRGIALVGVIQAMSAKQDYDGVIDYYNRHSETLPAGHVRPKVLLLVGHAYRMRKSYARAVEVYLIIEQYHKDTDEAFEAGYWKLYCFYLLNDKDLGEFANGFIARYMPAKGDHEFLSLARLIRADFFFNKGDFNQAAISYTELKIEKLAEKLRPGTVFNMGWAQAESGRHQDAVVTFTRFLTDFPGHAFAAKALARRGMANRDARDLPKAKADFERVTKDFPESDASEVAWLQLGLIGMELKDSKASIIAFETLLKKFPHTPAAAQAQYGIGRGYLDQKSYDKAIPALRRSLELDNKTYFEKASQMLMLCEYASQNVGELAKTVDGYLAAKPVGSVSPNILKWLGLKLYGAEEFKKAARYLGLVATPETPENTEPAVWIYLAMSHLSAGNHDQSIIAADHYLKSNPDPSSKARALITKGRAQLGKGSFGEADKTTQEALAFVKDGKLQAELLILEGDIYNAHGDDLAKQTQIDAARAKWQAAAGKYAVPSQVFEDDQVTPEALHKAALTFDKLGDAAQAQKIRQQLKQRYPKWQPKP